MEKQDCMKETITTLNLVNYQVAELLRIKEELEARLCSLFEHGDDHSKTYTFNKHKVTITTGYNYSLDKDEYIVLRSKIPSCFNPVKERIAYDLDKSVIRDCEKYCSPEELELISQFITKKPKKLHVKVSAAV